jgi:hypothetical protein
MKAETFKVLKQAAVPPKQAWAIACAVELECAAGHDRLATKTDLSQMATKVDLANLRADLVRWLFLVILGQTAVLASAGYFYINALTR